MSGTSRLTDRRCPEVFSLSQFDELQPGDALIVTLPRRRGENLAVVQELDWPFVKVKACGDIYRIAFEAVKRFAPPTWNQAQAVN